MLFLASKSLLFATARHAGGAVACLGGRGDRHRLLGPQEVQHLRSHFNLTDVDLVNEIIQIINMSSFHGI